MEQMQDSATDEGGALCDGYQPELERFELAKKKRTAEATHGGKRENAGRKTVYDAPKQVKSIFVSPEFKAFMDSLPNASKHIEETLRKSKAFREWRGAQKNG